MLLGCIVTVEEPAVPDAYVQIICTRTVWPPVIEVNVSVSWAANNERTALTCESPSDVGAVGPVQNLSFRVVGGGLSDPVRAELIFTLNDETPDVAVTLRSMSMVTVPPESPITVSVKLASLFDDEKDPAKPWLTASA